MVDNSDERKKLPFYAKLLVSAKNQRGRDLMQSAEKLMRKRRQHSVQPLSKQQGKRMRHALQEKGVLLRNFSMPVLATVGDGPLTSSVLQRCISIRAGCQAAYMTIDTLPRHSARRNRKLQDPACDNTLVPDCCFCAKLHRDQRYCNTEREQRENIVEQKL